MKTQENRTDPGPDEINILRRLAETDYSADSRIRLSLKHNLLERIAKPARGYRRISGWQIGLAAALIVAFALAASPIGASLAQGLITILDRWQFGGNTTVVSVDGDFEALPDGSGGTIVNPVEAPETEDAAAPELDGERHLVLDPGVSFEAAQEMVTFALQMPAYVPDGYTFMGVTVGRPGQASVEYANFDTARLIGILQTAVGGVDRSVQVTFSGDVVVVETEVGGIPALWTLAGDEGLLVWETGGVNYQLVGTSDLETALRIAESLH